MTTAIPDTLETSTGAPVTHSVILLHGLGADGHDFEPLVPELGLPTTPGIRFVFPHAPVRPITINGGLSMRGWYDIASPAIVDEEDEDGIRQSAEILDGLVEREAERGIPAERVFVAGFSQGGAVALHYAMRQNVPLAGVIALSTYLPLSRSLDAELADGGRQTPVFMAHGDQDPVISPELALASKERLEQAGVTVAWHGYGMDHSVCREEIGDLRSWLIERIGEG